MNQGIDRNVEQNIMTDAVQVVADRAFPAHLQWSATEAVVASTTGIHAAVTASNSAATVVTTDFTQPACAKNVTATAGGTAADIKAVQVIVEGTNMNDEVISETLPVFTENTAGSVTGSKAFKTVTKMTIPAMDGAAATVALGFGEKLGLPFKIAHDTVLKSYRNNTLEGTAATVTVSSTALESNTIDLNSALNGSVVDVYLLV